MCVPRHVILRFPYKVSSDFPIPIPRLASKNPVVTKQEILYVHRSCARALQPPKGPIIASRPDLFPNLGDEQTCTCLPQSSGSKTADTVLEIRRFRRLESHVGIRGHAGSCALACGTGQCQGS